MKVVLYYRVSTKDQKEALQSQKQELFRYAHKNLHTVAGTFYDIDSSQKLFDRMGLVDLLNFCVNKDVDAILVTEPDRLSRNIMHMGFIKVNMQREGIEIIAINSPVETTNDPTARLMAGILDLFAEWEYNIRRIRTTRGWALHKKQKKHLGRCPYGYTFLKGDLHIIESQTSIVRLIFELAAKQKKYGKLNYSNIAKQVGFKWLNKVKYIIRNPFYAGFVCIDGNYLQGKHDPIIPLSLFLTVNPDFEFSKNHR